MSRTRLNVQRAIGFILGGILTAQLITGAGYWTIGTLFALIFVNIFSAWIRITYKGKDL